MKNSRARPSASSKLRAGNSETKPVARRGRPVGDRAAKRDELLRAAISVIGEEGYAGSSLRKVAQRAGCTTGAVTYNFANKEALVAALAESLFDEFDTFLEAGQERIDIKGITKQWLDWTSSHAEAQLVLLQLLAQARNEPAFASVFRRRYARFRREFSSILERGQVEGIIRNDIAADLLADQLCAIGDGWTLTLPVEPDRFKATRRKVLLDSVMTLISPPRGSAAKTKRKR